MLSVIMFVMAVFSQSGHFTVSPGISSHFIVNSGAEQRDLRPVVYVYNAPFNCPPCRQQEADFRAWEKSGVCPVRFIWDVEPRIKIESYPATHWNGANGKGVVVAGWYGRERWLKAWELSQRKKE
jgi:hypothetical protein